MTRPVAVSGLLLLVAACETPADAPAAPPDAADHVGMDHGPTGHGAADESSYTDLRFLDEMAHHHEMAVEMARAVLDRGADAETRGLAEAVVRTQSAEVDTMRAWRARWFPDAPAPGPMTADDMARMGMAAPMDSLESGADPDRVFLELMVPHHAGAVVMASEAEARTRRPELRAFARRIVRDQAREIGQMETGRARLDGR